MNRKFHLLLSNSNKFEELLYNITNGQEIYMNQKWTITFRPHKIRQLNTFCKEKDTDVSLMCASVLGRFG